MQDSLQALKQLTDAVHPLPPNDLEALSAIWQPISAGRKETLTIQGEKEKHLYIVLSGVQRVFYFDDQGREATLVFTYSPSFGGVLDALLLQQPSRYFYETLTPSTFLRTGFEELNQLITTRPAIALLINKGLTHSLSGILERLVELQCYTSEDKFKQLLKRSPHILQLVPHKYLANYLGIDATNFSKLINKIKI